MTPILAHLHQHFPADWKQAPSPGTPLHFWYQAAHLAAYLEIGDERLYVRWFDGENPKGQYGGAGVGLEVTPTRVALDEAIPAAVAQAAVARARRGLLVPAVPGWAEKALGVAVACRFDDLAEQEKECCCRLADINFERARLCHLKAPTHE